LKPIRRLVGAGGQGAGRQRGAEEREVLFSQPGLPSSKLPTSFLSVAVIGNLVALILTNSRNAWRLQYVVLPLPYQGWRWLMAGVVGVAGVSSWRPSASPLQQWLSRGSCFLWVKRPAVSDRPLVLLRTTNGSLQADSTASLDWLGITEFHVLYGRRCTFGWVIPTIFC